MKQLWTLESDMMEWLSANYSIWGLVFPLVTWRLQVVLGMIWDDISEHHCIQKGSIIMLYLNSWVILTRAFWLYIYSSALNQKHFSKDLLESFQTTDIFRRWSLSYSLLHLLQTIKNILQLWKDSFHCQFKECFTLSRRVLKPLVHYSSCWKNT